MWDSYLCMEKLYADISAFVGLRGVLVDMAGGFEWTR